MSTVGTINAKDRLLERIRDAVAEARQGGVFGEMGLLDRLETILSEHDGPEALASLAARQEAEARKELERIEQKRQQLDTQAAIARGRLIEAEQARAKATPKPF